MDVTEGQNSKGSHKEEKRDEDCGIDKLVFGERKVGENVEGEIVHETAENIGADQSHLHTPKRPVAGGEEQNQAEEQGHKRKEHGAGGDGKIGVFIQRGTVHRSASGEKNGKEKRKIHAEHAEPVEREKNAFGRPEVRAEAEDGEHGDERAVDEERRPENGIEHRREEDSGGTVRYRDRVKGLTLPQHEYAGNENNGTQD